MNVKWIATACAALLLTSQPCLKAADALIVFAAASLSNACRDSAKFFPGKVVFNFGASSVLARQIEAGAPCDVFFSADTEKMKTLEKWGFIQSGSRRDLLSNQLVVMVPPDSAVSFTNARGLLDPLIKRIALAETHSVPAGIYARHFLEGQGVWEQLAQRVVPVDNVRAALAAVEAGNADAAIVYRSDATMARRAKVAWRIPVEEGPKIVFPVAVLKETRQPILAQKWVEFMAGKEAGAIFEKHGFALIPRAATGVP